MRARASSQLASQSSGSVVRAHGACSRHLCRALSGFHLWLPLFHSGTAIQLIPIGWGFYLLVSYETWGERVTAYVATVLSFVWIYFACESNIQLYAIEG